MLERWAGDFRFQNGLQNLVDRKHLFIYIRGGNGQPRTWIDHVLHKGEPTSIALTAGYVSHAPEWEGITDHWPIQSTYATHSPAQSVPKQEVPQKVHWELKLTGRQKVDEFVESMEKYDDEHPCPTDISTMEAIQDYMRNLETHAARTVKQLYRRAGQEEQQSSHKDGWSPVFIGYKAHLTALIVIRRHLLGHKGTKRLESAHDMRRDLDQILPEWEGKVAAAGLRKEEIGTIQECTSRPLHWWQHTSELPTTDMLDEDRELIKRCLHGALRREYRRNINKHFGKVEIKKVTENWRLCA